jgi:hypothetical protein
MLKILAGCLVLLNCGTLSAASTAETYGIKVTKANLLSIGDSYYLGADIDYHFNPPVIDALVRGVPLTLVVRLKIERERKLWFNETLLNEKRSIQIRYHPLATSFQILDQTSGATQSFIGLPALLDTLSRLRGWEIAKIETFKPGQRYIGYLSVQLDIEALPLPLRAQAYLSPRWYNRSPVYTWPLAL